jgi:hypothetical protein
MKPETGATLKFVAFGFFLLFLIFLGLATPFYLRQRDVLKNWVVRDAHVQDSDVVSVPEKRGTGYDAHVVVEFRIGNEIHNVMINSGYPSRFRSHAQQWVARYPAGSTVLIAYNPLYPSQVRLDPGYNRYFFAIPLLVTEVGLGFALAAALFYLVARRAGPPPKSS